jgi:DNA-directed RNA polymerase specialized sigma24 family protein
MVDFWKVQKISRALDHLVSGILACMQWDGVHQLVERAKTGDSEALASLYVMVQPYLMGMAQKLLGPDWPHQSVSELTQETWIKVLGKIESFRGGKGDVETGPQFRAWLNRTIKNVRLNDRRFVMALRRKQPEGALRVVGGESDSSSAVVDPPARDPTASASARLSENQERIQQALKRFRNRETGKLLSSGFFRTCPLRRSANALDSMRAPCGTVCREFSSSWAGTSRV